MEWKKIEKKLLYPPGWVMICLAVFSAVSLVIIFTKGLEEIPIAYAVYLISFYALFVICIFSARVLPGYYRAVKQRIYDNP